jgi:hypothetical protein
MENGIEDEGGVTYDVVLFVLGGGLCIVRGCVVCRCVVRSVL